MQSDWMFVAPCAANQWTCFNRQCVSENATCDAKTDCNDGSDETYTHARCGGKIDAKDLFTDADCVITNSRRFRFP